MSHPKRPLGTLEKRSPWNVLRKLIAAAFVLAYPFLVVVGLDHSNVRTTGSALLTLAVLAALPGRSGPKRVVALMLQRFGAILVVSIAAVATGHPLALLFLPTATSLWLFYVFASSLREEVSIIARFAKAMHNDQLPDFLIPYCRNVTRMWCAFFLVNALTAGVLAVTATPRAWALYTGGISYGLIGAVAFGEYLFHKSRFRFYESGWDDRLWRRWLPPEGSPLGRRTLAWQQRNSNRTPKPSLER